MEATLECLPNVSVSESECLHEHIGTMPPLHRTHRYCAIARRDIVCVRVDIRKPAFALVLLAVRRILP